jgi:metallo-beta-lactamase class B
MMKRFFAVLLLLSTASLAAAELARVPPEWNQPIAPFRIIDNIYYVGANELTSYLITTPEGHILLDSGAAETVPQILQNIGRLGFRAEDVKILINSHAHFDHAGGFAQLKRLTGAKIHLTAEDAPLAKRGGTNDPHFGDTVAFEPFRPDVLVRDGRPVRLGGVKVTPHLTPGHTQGCTTWSMSAREGDERHSVVFVCSVTAPEYRLVGNPAYPDAVADYRRSFKVLKSLNADVLLAAHGSFFGLTKKAPRAGSSPNPFIDAAEYRTFVEKSERAIEEKIAAQSAAAE